MMLARNRCWVPPHVPRDLLLLSREALLFPRVAFAGLDTFCVSSLLNIQKGGSLLQVVGYPESRDDVSMRPRIPVLGSSDGGDRDVVLCTQDGKQSLRTFCSGERPSHARAGWGCR